MTARLMQKIILFFILVILLSPQCFALANVEINEIMYNLKTGSDNGREWMELYNNADVPIDISAFRLFEGDTNHKIKLVQGDANIVAHGYALIVSDPVKFKVDWPSLFSGPIFVSIFDSSFSLSNDGELLAIKDAKLNIIDQYAYTSSSGGAGDGKSLQKISGVWQAVAPTPGEENKLPLVPVSLPKTIVAIKSPKTAAKVSVAQSGLVNKKSNVYGVSGVFGASNAADVAESTANYFPVVFFIILLALSAALVYFIRQNRTGSKAGDDFEILEE